MAREMILNNICYRQEAIQRGDKITAENCKLMNNGHYGWLCQDASKHTETLNINHMEKTFQAQVLKTRKATEMLDCSLPEIKSMIDEQFWYLFFDNEMPITAPIKHCKVDTFAHRIFTNGEYVTPEYSYDEYYKNYIMQQIMTKSKSIVCLDTQNHNNVEGNALEWLREEQNLSDRVFLPLRV